MGKKAGRCGRPRGRADERLIDVVGGPGLDIVLGLANGGAVPGRFQERRAAERLLRPADAAPEEVESWTFRVLTSLARSNSAFSTPRSELLLADGDAAVAVDSFQQILPDVIGVFLVPRPIEGQGDLVQGPGRHVGHRQVAIFAVPAKQPVEVGRAAISGSSRLRKRVPKRATASAPASVCRYRVATLARILWHRPKSWRPSGGSSNGTVLDFVDVQPFSGIVPRSRFASALMLTQSSFLPPGTSRTTLTKPSSLVSSSDCNARTT